MDSFKVGVLHFLKCLVPSLHIMYITVLKLLQLTSIVSRNVCFVLASCFVNSSGSAKGRDEEQEDKSVDA